MHSNERRHSGLTQLGPGRARAARILVAAALTIALSSVGVALEGSVANAAGGSSLLSETFQGASVSNTGLLPLSTACLTGATAAGSATTLGACTHTTKSPTSGALPGYLQLTDTEDTQVGGLVDNRPLPASGGLDISFDQYQYGGTGADGIGFFLSNGSATLSAVGQSGGALGYSNNGSAPGVHDAYLGIGLDAYGNFVKYSGTGCSSTTSVRSPNTVALKGPGDGTVGYCNLASTDTSPGVSSLTASQTIRGTTLANSDRTIHITVSTAALPTVVVTVDFHDGNGPVTVINAQMPTAAPPTYKFGFASSTGASNDVHLIRNLSVSSLVTLPPLTLTKQVDNSTAQPASYTTGSVVPYQFLLTNTSADALTTVAVQDPHITNVVCPSSTLTAVGTSNSSEVCTGSYAITAADAHSASGAFSNTATATAIDVTAGSTITSNSSSATVNLTAQPAVTIAKHAVLADTNGNGTADVGESIDYTFLITDTGNRNLTGVGVTDAKAGTVSCPSSTLAVDASETCSANYLVTQADVDSGSVNNTATVHATSSDGTAISGGPSSTSTPTTVAPALTVSKSALPQTVTLPGQAVHYSFLVTNTGNQTLSNVAVADTLAAPAGPAITVNCPTTTLAPAVAETCTATYAATQADIDNGGIGNSAVASGRSPSGTIVHSTASVAAVSATRSPALGITDTNPTAPVTQVGQTIPFMFTVKNTGNVTLTGVTVTNGSFSGVGMPATAVCTPAVPATLAPGASLACTIDYVSTQADLDAGAVSLVERADGTPPSGSSATPTATSAVETATVTQSPSLTLAKSVSPTTATTAGTTIDYSFVITNTGNVTLANVAPTELVFSGTGPALVILCPAGAVSLAPAAAVTCTASYLLTQADVDAGTLTNTASASGTSPSGVTTTLTTSSASVSIPPTASLSLTKSVSPSDAASFHVGTVATYSFAITNTGNITLGNVHPTEVSFTGSGTLSSYLCPAGAAALAPGAQVVCSESYTLTQHDIDDNVITNSARATGTSPSGGTVVSTLSMARDPVNQVASLSVAKTSSVVSVAAAGDPITYSFTVTNTGSVTLTNVTATEAAFSGTGTLSPVLCPAAASSVVPGASVTCTAMYSATQHDIDAGSITNSASATGTPPTSFTGAAPIATASTTTVAAAQAAALIIKKTADVGSVTKPGDVVTYSFLITNTGNVTLTSVRPVEGLFTGHGALSTPVCPAGAASLAPGDSVTCTATYAVVAADIGKSSSLQNTATATAVAPLSDVAAPPVAAASSVVIAAIPVLGVTGLDPLSTIWTALGLLVTGALFYSLTIIRRRRTRPSA